MGQLRVMRPSKGDEHLEWDPKDAKSVKAAKERFDALVNPKTTGKNAHKFNAYKVERVPQRTGEAITEFDKDAGEILLVPAMAGG